MGEVVMPRLSDSMEEGTIIRWLKGDGDEVTRGDELVEIETDKATMTYEADADGVLEVVASEGDTLPIGEVIARIGSGSGNGAEPATAPAESEAPAAPADAPFPGEGQPRAAPAEAPAPTESLPPPEPADAPAPGESQPRTAPAPAGAAAAGPPPTEDGRRKASPVARRIARERGLDLRALSGSGPGGRIVRADVEDAPADPAGAAEVRPAPPAVQSGASAAPAPPAPSETGAARGSVTVHELSRTQQVIARRMAESRATVPDFTLQARIDMEAAVAAREQLKRAATGEGAVPSFNDFVVKACALALREFPRANGSYRDGRFELHSRVNIGIAVAAQDALVVPTLFDADRKTLGEIAGEARLLATKVRNGNVTPPELSGGTFTVSNLGMYGISNFTAVINPPQAAILAVGEVAPQAVVHDGGLVARHVLGVTLACDHRILYGAEAAEFLGRVRALLEAPMALAL